jgi:hypothetical protein
VHAAPRKDHQDMRNLGPFIAILAALWLTACDCGGEPAPADGSTPSDGGPRSLEDCGKRTGARSFRSTRTMAERRGRARKLPLRATPPVGANSSPLSRQRSEYVGQCIADHVRSASGAVETDRQTTAREERPPDPHCDSNDLYEDEPARSGGDRTQRVKTWAVGGREVGRASPESSAWRDLDAQARGARGTLRAR